MDNRSSVFFSVVIPLYNKRDTIRRTLLSVFNQTFADFEVIVIDDGSSDNGADTAKETYRQSAQRWPFVIIRQENAGVSVARNKGVEASVGRYVAILDADDEWHPEFLSELVKIVSRYPHAKVIGTDYKYMRGSRSFSGLDNDKIEEVDFFSEWPYRSPINSSCSAFLRAFYVENGGFNPTLRYYEDAELLFRLAVRTRFHLSRRVLSSYHTDARHRATGTGHSQIDRPHLKFAETFLKQGIAPESLKDCVRREIEWLAIENARRFYVDRNQLLARTFERGWVSVPVHNWFVSAWKIVLIYPYVLFRAIIVRWHLRSCMKVLRVGT